MKPFHLLAALLCLGLCGCHPGRFFETRPWLRTTPSEFDLLKDAPPDRQLTYALACETQGQFKRSLRHYRLACEEDSLIPEARFGMARVFFLKGNPSKALASARKALDLDPSLSARLNDFLWSQAFVGKTPRLAVQLAELAIDNAKEHRAGCLDTLAFIRIQRGELSEAEEALDRAEKALPTAPAAQRTALEAWLLFHRAAVARERGDRQAEEDLLAKAHKRAKLAEIQLEP